MHSKGKLFLSNEFQKLSGLTLVSLRKAQALVDSTEKASGTSSSSATPTLVLDSLPFGTDDRDTLEMHPTELDLLAQTLKDMPSDDKKSFVPHSPTVSCF